MGVRLKMTTLPTHSVGAYEAKTNFSALLEKVESGEEIKITKHGTPVAWLVPVKKSITRRKAAKKLGVKLLGK